MNTHSPRARRTATPPRADPPVGYRGVWDTAALAHRLGIPVGSVAVYVGRARGTGDRPAPTWFIAPEEGAVLGASHVWPEEAVERMAAARTRQRRPADTDDQ